MSVRLLGLGAAGISPFSVAAALSYWYCLLNASQRLRDMRDVSPARV